VDCIGKVRTHGILGDEVHLHTESPGKFVLDPDKRKKAFFAGEPDQDIIP
jgi:hypothetical protein